MANKKLPKLELKVPSNKKRNLKGNLVDRSELPSSFKDFNRFNPENQPKYELEKRRVKRQGL